MIDLFEEIKRDLEKVSQGQLVVPRVPAPEKKRRGMRKVGVLSAGLRKLCALNESYLTKMNTPPDKWNRRLEAKQKIVLAAYKLLLEERYGTEKPVIICNNWAVYFFDGFIIDATS